MGRRDNGIPRGILLPRPSRAKFEGILRRGESCESATLNVVLDPPMGGGGARLVARLSSI